jgi:uncharacterized protein YndB with AHSA1/START domain
MIYRRTVETSAGPALVWSALTIPARLQAWHGHAEVFEARPDGRILFRNPGWEDVEGRVIEVEVGKHLRWTALADGSVIDERIEATPGGTRITIGHLPGDSDEAAWLDDFAALELGWDESIADLVLYLEHEVMVPRHMTARRELGATTRDTAAGVEVTTVAESGFAARAGLRTGDLVTHVNVAPIFTRRDLALLLREHPAGTMWEVQIVRGGRLHRSRASL